MSVLGVTFAGTPLPSGCTGLPSDTLSLVSAPAMQQRDRLAVQLSCHRTNPAFLPLSARSPISTLQAERWVARQRASVREALERIEGQTQLTLHFSHPTPPKRPTDSGTAWLHQRALNTRIRTELQDVLECRAEGRTYRLQHHRTGLALHLLVPSCNVGTQAADWNAALSGPDLSMWQMVLSGGWPPVAFGPDPAP